MATQDIRIGWIGLGEMGYGMAKNLNAYLVSQGSHLTVWNRSPGKTDAIQQQGAHVASSVEDITSTSNIIFTSLANDAAVENVYEQLLQVASKSQEQIIFIDTSTIHPTTATKISQLVSAYPQHRYLQCPVFGRPDRAYAAKLIWVASGDAAAIEKLQPYFASMSQKTIDLKTLDVSKASSFKLLGNFFVVGTVELLAEGFALAEKIDIEKSAVLGFIESFFPTPSWIGYSQKIASGSTEKAGGFPVELGLKDVGHMRKLAADHGATLPTADVAYKNLEKLKAQGKGDQDWSSIFEVLREGPSSQEQRVKARLRSASAARQVHPIRKTMIHLWPGTSVEPRDKERIKRDMTSQQQNIRIGWIGLGLLGFEMAQHLQKYLHTNELPSLTVWNRTSEKAERFQTIAAPGTRIVHSLKDFFVSNGPHKATNVLFTSLQNDNAVEQVYETLLQQAATAQEQIIFVETGTLYPELSLRLQKQLADLPQHHIYLQCPVFGMPEVARMANMVWVASGDADAIKRLLPYFESMSRTVLDLKTTDVSAGSTLKLLGNFMLMTQTAMLAESINVARKAGLDPQHLVSWIDLFMPVPILTNYSRTLVNGAEDERVDMVVNIGEKDVGCVRRWAKTKGAPMPIANAVHENLVTAKEKGFNKDWNFLIDSINSRGTEDEHDPSL
ncbi:hypothetical protein EC991_000717 [Linnemannia zychae]|nr:hypothetical protein EC991_000717 [Linnemannia zychae]